ncbi:MAG: porin family protein [Rhodobacteraceae bacterium]|nr:porin family protein [Paracoccaceae bacterium]
MKRRITGFAGVAAMAAMPAFAGGLVQPTEEPMVAPAPMAMPAPSTDWSGLYAGGQLGYGDVGSTGALAGDGMTAGVFAGYRADFGQFVTGVEGNFDWANIDLGGGTSLDSISRLKLIGGYDVGPALVYGTVAAVRADTTLGADNGWGAGIGVDYAVTQQMTLGAELMEHRFDNFVGSGTDIEATTLNARVGFRF